MTEYADETINGTDGSTPKRCSSWGVDGSAKCTKPEEARVVHNADRHRFELRVRGEPVGILGYFDLRHLTEPLRIQGNIGPSPRTS